MVLRSCFEGVNADGMAQLKREIEEGERPADLPATALTILHDPDTETSLSIVFFESKDDYRKGDAFLDSMPRGDTPGQHTSVKK